MFSHTIDCARLTHWGRVTHICVDNLTIIGSYNGLSPGWHQAIIWTNAGILLIGPLGKNFNEILIEMHTFSFKKMHLKMLSGKRRPFCLGLNVLTPPLSFRREIHLHHRCRETMKKCKFDMLYGFMMTSSNENIYRVTGHLCGEFTGPGEFPTQRPVTRSFDVYFDLRPNKWLSKQSWGWWFETLSCSLWRHRNVYKQGISEYVCVCARRYTRCKMSYQSKPSTRQTDVYTHTYTNICRYLSMYNCGVLDKRYSYILDIFLIHLEISRDCLMQIHGA